MDNLPDEIPDEYRCQNCLQLIIPNEQIKEYKEAIKEHGKCRLCKPPKLKRRRR